MAYLKRVAKRGVMLVQDVPVRARPLYGGCRYIVRNVHTEKLMQEFRRKTDAIAWAERNRRG